MSCDRRTRKRPQARLREGRAARIHSEASRRARRMECRPLRSSLAAWGWATLRARHSTGRRCPLADRIPCPGADTCVHPLTCSGEPFSATRLEAATHHPRAPHSPHIVGRDECSWRGRSADPTPVQAIDVNRRPSSNVENRLSSAPAEQTLGRCLVRRRAGRCATGVNAEAASDTGRPAGRRRAPRTRRDTHSMKGRSRIQHGWRKVSSQAGTGSAGGPPSMEPSQLTPPSRATASAR